LIIHKVKASPPQLYTYSDVINIGLPPVGRELEGGGPIAVFYAIFVNVFLIGQAPSLRGRAGGEAL